MKQIKIKWFIKLILNMALKVLSFFFICFSLILFGQTFIYYISFFIRLERFCFAKWTIIFYYKVFFMFWLNSPYGANELNKSILYIKTIRIQICLLLKISLKILFYVYICNIYVWNKNLNLIIIVIYGRS